MPYETTELIPVDFLWFILVKKSEKLIYIEISSLCHQGDLLNSSRSDILEWSIIDLQEELCELLHVDQSISREICSFKNFVAFIGSDLWINLNHEVIKALWVHLGILWVTFKDLLYINSLSRAGLLNSYQNFLKLTENFCVNKWISSFFCCNESMWKNFLPTHSVSLLKSQTLLDEILCIDSYTTIIRERHLPGDHPLFIGFYISSGPR